MPGRSFLQIPGPTLVPERIVRAMSQPIIDHRGPRFAALVEACLDGLKRVFQTRTGRIVLYPGSGTGAWEAAIVNTLSPGDRVLACINGHFSTGFARTAEAYGVECERVEVPYGDGAPADELERRLRADAAHQLKALLVVHNETSTGVTSNVAALRTALDRAQHPALLLVDTVSSLASIDFRFDDWAVDVALTGPQKGLMLPPGWRSSRSAKRPSGPATRRAARARTGTGVPSSSGTVAANSPTPPRRCSSSVSRRRSGCSTKRGYTTSSPATRGSPRRAGARCARSGSRSSAGIPPNTRTRSPRS